MAAPLSMPERSPVLWLTPPAALIPGVRIEITGTELTAPVVLSSDASTRFSSPDLKPGTVRAPDPGWLAEDAVLRTVELTGAVNLELSLAIAPGHTQVNVSGSSANYANSDPVYRGLQGVGLGDTFRIDHFTLPIDAATFRFDNGTVTFLAPVNGIVTGAIFLGEGHFLLPATYLDAQELKRRVGSPQFDEDFTGLIVRFAVKDPREIFQKLGDRVAAPEDATKAFAEWKNRMRKRREEPLGFTEQILHGDSMDNVDADLMAAVYNPAHPLFLNAYLRGMQHKDLRFLIRIRVGAVPQLDSAEEVALINYDPEGMQDGIWYLDHLLSEFEKNT